MSDEEDDVKINGPIPRKDQSVKFLGNSFKVTRVVPTSRVDGKNETVFIIYLSDKNNILSNNFIDSQRDVYEIVGSSQD